MIQFQYFQIIMKLGKIRKMINMIFYICNVLLNAYGSIYFQLTLFLNREVIFVHISQKRLIFWIANYLFWTPRSILVKKIYIWSIYRQIRPSKQSSIWGLNIKSMCANLNLQSVVREFKSERNWPARNIVQREFKYA